MTLADVLACLYMFKCLLLTDAHLGVVILICRKVFLRHATAHPPLPPSNSHTLHRHTNVNKLTCVLFGKCRLRYFHLKLFRCVYVCVCMWLLGHQVKQWGDSDCWSSHTCRAWENNGQRTKQSACRAMSLLSVTDLDMTLILDIFFFWWCDSLPIPG